MLSRFNDLNPETSALVESLLPDSVKQMARLVGLQAALMIVDSFGGTQRYFINWFRESRGRDFQLLCDLIGKEKAKVLSKKYHPTNGYMYIPRCLKAMNYMRNREIVIMFDKISSEISARQACNTIGIKFGLSDRAVETIVNGKGGRRERQS